jgi:hypothetical protein
MHFDDGSFDLAVVEVDSRMLERIPDRLLKIVEVTTSRIGWKQIELNVQQAGKRLANPPREQSADRFAVGSSFAAEERAIAQVSVIPIDARREWQHKPQHGYRWGDPVREGQRGVPEVSRHDRFQGGVDVLLAAFAGAGVDADVEATVTASRFL